jgi:RND family efflux transporter MFP subunit
MSRKNRIVLVASAGVVLLAVLVFVFAGWGSGPADSKSTAPEVPGLAVRVETTRPVRQNIRRISETTPAILLPHEHTDLYARIPGFIKEIHVDYGSRVKKGADLAILLVPEVEKELEQKKALVRRALAAVKVANAAVRTADAALAEANAGRKKAGALYQRWKDQVNHMVDLVGRKVIDEQNLDEARNQFKASEAGVDLAAAKTQFAQAALEESKANLEKAKADVSVAQADRDQTQAMLHYAKVVAPYDGVVSKRHLHTGALINPKGGEQMPLFRIVRTDLLRVVVDVAERDVGYLTKNAKVAAEFDGLPGKRFEWKVSRLAPVLGRGKRVRVEVGLSNADGTFYPGMYGRAWVILEEKSKALTVPAACIAKDDKGNFVWLAVAGKAKARRVLVGIREGGRAEIISGLNEEDEVVSSGKEALHEGRPLLIQGSSKK